MASGIEYAPNQAATEQVTAHVLRMTTGLSCEGDSVAMTSATSPSLEDIIQGVIPGMPKVVIHNQVIALKSCAPTISRPGTTPSRASSTRSCSSSRGRSATRRSTATATGRASACTPTPASRSRPTCGSTGSRPRPPRSYPGRRHLRHLRRHPGDEANPTGAMGLPDYLGWKRKSTAGLPVGAHPRVPRPAGQHDRDADVPRVPPGRHGAGAGAGRTAAAEVALRGGRPARAATGPASSSRAGSRRSTARDHHCLVKLRPQGPGDEVQRARPRVGERHRRLPERRRHLHGVHHARLPGQVHAVHGGRLMGQGRPRTSSGSATGR